MTWHPNDLLTDADLLAYERTILEQFGQYDWQSRRAKVLEDWLFPLLEATGFDPQRFRTRFQPRAVWSQTSSAWADRTEAAGTDDGLSMAAVLAAPADGLYVGFDAPFRGLSVRMLDSVSATPSTLSVSVWADTWQPVDGLENGTATGAASFTRGGALTWCVPETLVTRPLQSSSSLYWCRLQATAAPVGALVGPLSVIRRSRLCAAVTFRTLALIFREAPISRDGPWDDKAKWYEQEAERSWLRVADHIGGEFDTDGDDVISPTEEAQTADEVTGGGWRWERC